MPWPFRCRSAVSHSHITFPKQHLLVVGFTVFVIFMISHAEAQVSCVPAYVKEYVGSGSTEPLAVRSLADGNFLVAGRGTATAGDLVYDGLVMKVSGSGAVLWSFLIGGTGNDAFSGIVLLNDGTFLLYGTTSSNGHPEGKPWLVDISPAGALIWSRQLGNTVTSVDRIKAVRQFSDGDLIGTFNSNDSSAQSDPVVFKIGLNGSLRWAHVFDNGKDDSFTGLGFSGSTIYAGGYYTDGVKRGVITRISSVDGSLIDAQNVFLNGTNTPEEVRGLEVYNNIISYGLWMLKPSAYTTTDSIAQILLLQTDMSGKAFFNILYTDDEAKNFIQPKRTSDNGFIAFLAVRQSGSQPAILKFNRYGMNEWLVSYNYYNPTLMAVDETQDGGCVAAANYTNYLTGQRQIMNISRTNSAGATGGCIYVRDARSYDTLSQKQQSFSWARESVISPAVLTSIADPSQGVVFTPRDICGTSFCTDKTPLPAGCGKTYRIEYTGSKSTRLRDVVSVATPDGSKIAVGDSYNDGLVMKYGANGDILWSKTYEEFNHVFRFMRVIRASDDNIFVFANNFWTEGFYGKDGYTILKLDLNGNVLWSKDVYAAGDVKDVAVTPDNGFVVLSDPELSGPTTNSYVARYDAGGSLVWQKTMTHAVRTPLYRSVVCTGDAVLCGYDAFDSYNGATFGVDKLSLSTGTQLWSQRYNAGNNNTDNIRMNRIAVINDTAYVFYNKNTPVGTGYSYEQHIAMTELDGSGNVLKSMVLQGDNVLSPESNGYEPDWNPPTVTLTPFFDFVLTSRVLVGTDSMLNVSRFLKDGSLVWSRNFMNMKGHSPFNIHPQANGFLITGMITGPRTDYVTFTNAFLLKIDSGGQVTAGATGDCEQQDRPLALAPLTASITSPTIDAIQPYTYAVTSAGSVSVADIPMDATLYCNMTKICDQVGFQQKGTGCSLSDTLIYFLEDHTLCDAAVTWQYDPALFKPSYIDGDSLRLVPLQKGSSTVTATIEGNCTLTVKHITASTLISASDLNIGPDTVICKMENLRVSAGPVFAGYQWNDNSTDSILQITAPGKYYVTVTDNCGGSSTDTVVVTLADSSFHVKGDSVSCNGGRIFLVASEGYNNYQWTPAPDGGVKEDSAFLSPTISGLYSVSAEKRPGCIVTAVRPVTALSSPPVQLGIDKGICRGDSLLLDAGAGFDHYSWNNGDTTELIFAKDARQYVVAAKYSNGCVSKDSLVLTVNALPHPELDKDPAICKGNIRVLDAGSGYQDYLWSDGSKGVTLAVQDTGVYWVQVKDANGCSGSDTTDFTGKECMPGLYVPSAFTPGGGANQVFRPIVYRQMSSYHFAVYSRWGQQVFASDVPMAGWDGRIGGKAAAMDTYVWFCRYAFEGTAVQTVKGTVELVR